MAELSYAQVSALLKYDSETGKLFWKERPIELFKGARGCAMAPHWNKKHAGKEAFTFVNKTGYRKGTILGQQYEVHRIVWLMGTGEWPSRSIDHIDGDTLNNRLDNLRLASHAENARNMRMRVDNTSGVNGVYWSKSSRKWHAKIRHGRWEYLGAFDRLEDAAEARRAANLKYGFTERHGEPLALKETTNG
jgi:hypothetical protein